MPLTQKEKDFCKFFCSCKNPREAAAKAGFVFPERAGLRLLGKKSIRDEISLISEGFERLADAADGLRRLAFGSVTDAVKLVIQGAEVKDLEGLDLFSVSEIKMSKGGGIEVKFHDRIKALEALATVNDSGGDSGAPFIEAIVKASEAINDTVRSDDDEF